MKDSEIYKYALIATMKELLSDAACGDIDKDGIYEIVSTLCNNIDLALFCESEAKEGEENDADVA